MKRLLFILFVLPLFYSFQLESQMTYTKIVIEQSIDPDQEMAITEHFQHMSGMRTCRMDRNTHVFLAIYDPSQIQEVSFTNWFTNNGFTVSCFYTDDYKEGEMVSISITNCK
ncbi:MAG: hypothetical protein ACOVO3_06560 [Fluviicola sp.]|jgi:hypothetical protein